MKAEHDQMEGTYGMQSPMETAVKYAPEVLSFGIAGGAKSVAATEAVVEYGLSRADGYSQGQSLARAATIGIVAGGAERVLNGPNLTNADGLTTEADDLLQYMNIKKGTKEYDTLVKEAKAVDVDDQVRVIAEQGGAKTEGVINQSMKFVDDQTRMEYAERLAKTRKDFAEATNLDDIEGIERATKQEYALMRDALRNMSGNTPYDVSGLSAKLKDYAPFARNDASVNKILNMVEQIDSKPTRSLDEIMDIRQELNYEYGKTTNETAKKMLGELKANVDMYFKHSGISPQARAMMDSSINSYNRMKSQKELVGLVDKNTKTLGKGSAVGEVKVVNWGQLLDDVKNSDLSGVVQDEIKLLEDLSNKYGSTQFDRLIKTGTKGSEDIVQTLSSSVGGAAQVLGVRKLIEFLAAHIPLNNTAKLKRIQRAIASSMERNKDYADFAKDMIKDKNIPLNIKQRIQSQIEAIEDEIKASDLDPATKRRDIDFADKALQAKRNTLKGKDLQLARQQTNLNKEIRARFRTKTVGADDRLEHARIEEKIVTARNSGDRTGVKEATSELEAFNEHTKSLPSREKAVEAKERLAKVAKEQRRADREAESARAAVRQEANQRNQERLRRARESQRQADAEARQLREDRARVEDQRIASREANMTAREQANENMVDSMNAKTDVGSWEVSTTDGNHPRFTNRETGSYFTLHQYDSSMGATTVGLHNGSGEGEKVYHSIFDMAEELGVYYKPDSTLLTANPVRTGMNMISYMKGRPEDANHIMMSPSQKAIGARGSENYLGNERLTTENANQLAMNMKNLVNRKLPSGTNLSASTTDAEIEQMARITGGDVNTRMGKKSLTLLRDFLASGRDLSTMP